MPAMKFTKMHGLGNDYVFVNCFEEQVADASSLARAISDRHEGVGSDGLILIGPSESGDVRMEIYNADGSRAQMCGNGIRCVARYAVEHDLAAGPIVQIETDAGVRNAECHILDGRVETVRVDMGKPIFDPAALPCTIEAEKLIDHPITISGQRFEMTCVSVGNPHAVIFVEHLHRIDLVELGPHVENAPVFPERMNAHFVRVDAPDHVTVRTWERGSGATRACGTGACAVCVAGAITNRTARRVIGTLPGGDLELEWAPDDHVYMTGPAVEVFTGDWPVD
jgi:diaminopimelate epimerase